MYSPFLTTSYYYLGLPNELNNLNFHENIFIWNENPHLFISWIYMKWKLRSREFHEFHKFHENFFSLKTPLVLLSLLLLLPINLTPQGFIGLSVYNLSPWLCGSSTEVCMYGKNLPRGSRPGEKPVRTRTVCTFPYHAGPLCCLTVFFY